MILSYIHYYTHLVHIAASNINWWHHKMSRVQNIKYQLKKYSYSPFAYWILYHTWLLLCIVRFDTFFNKRIYTVYSMWGTFSLTYGFSIRFNENSEVALLLFLGPPCIITACRWPESVSNRSVSSAKWWTLTPWTWMVWCERTSDTDDDWTRPSRDISIHSKRHLTFVRFRGNCDKQNKPN